jgi:hypothetical protein
MDQDLVCKDCGLGFVFSEKSQELYTEQGWNPPIRCYDCRQKKKARHAEKTSKIHDAHLAHE